MAENSFDVTVIGAGPGGYVAAIRAAQLGLKTALVEKRDTLGGTCLNIGCIPSKALLHSTEIYEFLREKGADHGIETGELKVDVGTLMKKKDAVVANLVKGVATLVAKKGVTVFNGAARIKDANTVEINGAKKETLQTKNIVLATGSRTAELPPLEIDGESIVTSDHAIAFDKAPGKLVVVGGGAIGLELGAVWSRLGSEVTVLEFLPRIAAGFDADISKALERILKKRGMKFATGVKVTGVKKKKGKLEVTAESDGGETSYQADKVLVAVGRQPCTEGLGLEGAGVELDDRKRIKTDDRFRTSIKNIYAIGDVIAGPMLAHKAEEEGVAVAEILAGRPGHVNYEVIPNVIYTDPEVASAGMGEDQAKDEGIKVNVGKFPLSANGRALAMDATDGMVKVIACARTDRVLGVQILARNASEFIAGAVAHMEYGGSAEDIARTVHAHPTVSESLKEAALAVDKRAIHAL